MQNVDDTGKEENVINEEVNTINVHKNDKFLPFFIGLIAIFIYYTVSIVLQYSLVNVANISLFEAPAYITIPISSSTFLLTAILITYLITVRDRPKKSFWKRFLELTKLNKIEARPTLIGVVIAPFVYLASVTIAGLLSGAFPNGSGGGNQTSERLSSLEGPSIFIAVLFVAILTPIFEEIFFRGIMMGAIERLSSSKWLILFSVLFTSVLFGSMHEQGPINSLSNAMAVITPTILGLLAAILTVKFKSLYPAIALHITYNSIVLLAIYNVFD